MDSSDINTHGQEELLGATHLAAAIVDTEGNVRQWTEGAERLLGYPAEEVVGRPAAPLLDADVSSEARRQLCTGRMGSANVVMGHRKAGLIGAKLFSVSLPYIGGAPGRLVVASRLEPDVDPALIRWALRARGSTLGTASFYRHRAPGDFDPDDLLLAGEVIARAAVNVENAQRYTRQRTTALTLRHSLLSNDLRRPTTVEVASRYLPSDSSDVHGGVDGNWLDVVPLAGTRVALVIGDVVGRGLRATATMGRLRTAVRTLADLELQPDQVLTHLDDLIGKPFATNPNTDSQPDLETRATCLYAVYNPVTGWCTMASAGHAPPVLVLPDGTVDPIDVPAGPPLGLCARPPENIEMQLSAGSLLALCTDGLIPSQDNEVDKGFADLMSRLALPAASLEETCDTILSAPRHHALPDGGALLLARTHMLHPDQVATWEFPSNPKVVAQARECASHQLSAWGLEDAVSSTTIIVSELVTNAIQYSHGPIQLRLILEDNLICEVSDDSNSYPRRRHVHRFDEGGRGLLLVEQLSQRWGTRPTTTGKIIWAEQSIPADRRTST
jgi:serine phosphatase RsbU (regulator of sigma subunit)/anti-sigma regulatory factor (Ser/Thr protein kinase)